MNLRSFEIMQEEKRLLPENGLKMILLNKAIEKYAYILHDKDVDEEGNAKRPHWHIICKLKYPQQTAHIAMWFGVPENFVNKIKGKWSDACKYLIHENAKEKYQYPTESVVSNFDYVDEKNKNFNSRLGEIISGISSGKIRNFNIGDYVLDTEYVKYKTSIQRAFEYRRKKVLKGGRMMKVFFISGASGVGKTTYAKAIADNLKMSFYVAGSTRDPFDGYEGQDCVILDDLRPDEHHISDLLKMMDNHTDSLVSSRYFDKSITEVKIMVITSIQTIEAFYKNALFSEPELATQLCRRVFGYICMDKETIILNAFSYKKNRYEEVGRMPNTVKEVYTESEESINRKIEDLKKTIKGAGESILKIGKNLEDFIEPPGES